MKKYLSIIKYEMLITIREQYQYKVQLFSEVIMFVFIYLAGIISNWESAFVVEWGVTKDTGVKLVFIGYTIWQIGIIALGYSSSIVKNEANQGILELKQQSIFPYRLLLFIRMCINVLTSIVLFLIISLVMMLVYGYEFGEYIRCCRSISFGLLSIFGMFGIGLLFGAITLHEKNIGQSVVILQTVLLFFSNIFSTSTGNIMKFIPYILGIDIGRKLYLGDHILISEVLLYIGVNVMWFVLGNLVFEKALRKESKIGMFDNY